MLLAMRLRSIQWRAHLNSSVTTPNLPRQRCASLSRALQIFNVRPDPDRSVSAQRAAGASTQTRYGEAPTEPHSAPGKSPRPFTNRIRVRSVALFARYLPLPLVLDTIELALARLL